MKVIVDTNVFMSGIFWAGIPAKILHAWQDNKIELVLSVDILEEYVRVGNILSKKYKGINIDEIIDLLMAKSAIYDSTLLQSPVCRDPDDDKFIACAISTNTQIVISGDSDLLELSGYRNIQILKPRQFYENYL